MTVGEAANEMRMSQLVRTIEQEIIPRLMLAHRVEPLSTVEPQPGREIGAADVEHFARLMLSHDEDLAFAAVRDHRLAGVPIDRIYLDLLGPTARYLGELWDEDLCTFTDVTVGLGRLQRLLRELSPSFGHAVEHPCDGRRILLLPAPGEQHTFGLVMVGEFFRKAGWDVSGGGWTAGIEPGELVASEWFDAIGFSLGAEIHLDALTEGIRAVKHETCNRDVVVLVGGPLFAEHPDYVERVGADGMTIDGCQAPELAERLLAKHSAVGAARRGHE